jgi:hypothetical protein
LNVVTRRLVAPIPVLATMCALFAGPVAAGDPASKTTGAAVKRPDAVLAMAAGPVTVRRGGEQLAAVFGAQLATGDVVATGPGAQAGILFVSGQIIEIGASSRITIGSLPSGGSKAGEDTAPKAPKGPDVLAGQLTRFSQSSTGSAGLSALPTLRGGETGEVHVEAITPRRTLVQPGTTAFQWTPVEGALEYRVTLTGPGAAQGSHRATEATWTLPKEAALKPGERWSWGVEAMTADGPVKSETYTFEVASDEVVRELAGLNERLEPYLTSDSEPRVDLGRYLMASYCRSVGLFGDAATQLEALVTRNPGRVELHRELGAVYQAIGRYDRAAEEYRLALKE